MGTPNDTSTSLYPGSGGDKMSESAPPRADGQVLKMPRVVLAGDGDEGAVIDPVRSGGRYELPVTDQQVITRLDRIVDLLSDIRISLASMSGRL